MKMEPTVSSETSAIRTQTPGNYPKRNKLQNYFCCFQCFSDFVDAAIGKQCLHIRFHNSVSVSAAFFYAGNSKVPSASGFKINDEKGS